MGKKRDDEIDPLEPDDDPINFDPKEFEDDDEDIEFDLTEEEE